MKIDWDEVVSCVGNAVACIIFAIIAGCGGVAVLAILVCVPLFGIALTIQGWWGIGIPITLLFLALDIALLVLLFAKIMSWIKERSSDGN